MLKCSLSRLVMKFRRWERPPRSGSTRSDFGATGAAVMSAARVALLLGDEELQALQDGTIHRSANPPFEYRQLENMLG